MLQTVYDHYFPGDQSDDQEEGKKKYKSLMTSMVIMVVVGILVVIILVTSVLHKKSSRNKPEEDDQYQSDHRNYCVEYDDNIFTDIACEPDAEQLADVNSGTAQEAINGMSPLDNPVFSLYIPTDKPAIDSNLTMYGDLDTDEEETPRSPRPVAETTESGNITDNTLINDKTSDGLVLHTQAEVVLDPLTINGDRERL